MSHIQDIRLERLLYGCKRDDLAVDALIVSVPGRLPQVYCQIKTRDSK
jgi:hypothetical protein